MTIHRSAVVKAAPPLLDPASTVEASLPKFETYETGVVTAAAVGFSSFTRTRAVSPDANSRYESVTRRPAIVCVDGVTTSSAPLGLTSTVPSSSATTVDPIQTIAPQSKASVRAELVVASKMARPGVLFALPPVGSPLSVPHEFVKTHAVPPAKTSTSSGVGASALTSGPAGIVVADVVVGLVVGLGSASAGVRSTSVRSTDADASSAPAASPAAAAEPRREPNMLGARLLPHALHALAALPGPGGP